LLAQAVAVEVVSPEVVVQVGIEPELEWQLRLEQIMLLL